MKQTQSQILLLQQTITSIISTLQQIDDKTERTSLEIDQCFDSLKHQLEQRREQLQNDFQYLTKQKKAFLSYQHQRMEYLLKNVVSVDKFTQTALNNPTELLANKQLIEDCLEQISTERNIQEDNHISFIQSNVEQLIQLSHSVGMVTANSAFPSQCVIKGEYQNGIINHINTFTIVAKNIKGERLNRGKDTQGLYLYL